MKNIKEKMLHFIAKYKYKDELEYEINMKDFQYLESCTKEFCYEVCRIFGSCKIYTYDSNIPGYKMVRIIKTSNQKSNFKRSKVGHHSYC